MAPFILVPYRPDYLERYKKANKMLYPKNVYNNMVKVADWEGYLGALPYDVNPYCPGSQNYFLSHYKRLGSQQDEPFSTTTQDMLEQIYTKKNEKLHIPTRLKMLNYLNFNDVAPCTSPDEKFQFCIQEPINDWMTTMQESYSNPLQCPMKGPSFPPIPFLKYRKIKSEGNQLSDEQFYDEGVPDSLEILQKYKSDQQISYNPMTEMYSDGAAALDKPLTCIRLPFDNRSPRPVACAEKPQVSFTSTCCCFS